MPPHPDAEPLIQIELYINGFLILSQCYVERKLNTVNYFVQNHVVQNLGMITADVSNIEIRIKKMEEDDFIGLENNNPNEKIRKEIFEKK